MSNPVEHECDGDAERDREVGDAARNAVGDCESIFFEALARNPGPDRAAYLARACGDRAELRQRVERLLAAHPQATNFMARPALEEQGLVAPSAAVGESAAAADAASAETPRSVASVFPFLKPAQQSGALGRLGHYEILEVLGEGGFGVVFRAFDESLERDVAIKVLAPQLAVTSPARKRFLREARAAAQVRHDNVVQVYAVEEEPLPFLIMEWIPGGSLQQHLDRAGPFDWSEVIQIGRQVAEGLAAAHQRGLIHRDIKPANILLESTKPTRVKITDFGIARVADDASATRTAAPTGTPMFMAPEQALGDSVDQRADLFSLGSVLYTLCTGRPPFRAPNVHAVLRRVIEDAPRPIPEVIPEVPPWLCQLIARLHAKNPRERLATARELADLLAAGNSGAPPAPAIESPPEPVAGGEPIAKPPVRRMPLVAGAAVLLMAVGAMWGLRGLMRWPGESRGGTARDVAVAQKETGTDRVEAPPQDQPSAASPDTANSAIVEPVQPNATELPAPAPRLTDAEQLIDVVRRLKELNPGFTGAVEHEFAGETLVGLRFNVDQVHDLSPLRALTHLESLDVYGTFPREGKLSDLAPLRALRLTKLICLSTHVADLAPLRDMPLKVLNCSHTLVNDLTPLRGMGLLWLEIAGTQVASLAPLAGMKLETLYAMSLPVQDLSPLADMPLKTLDLYRVDQATNLQPLRRLPLEWLNLSQTPVSDLAVLRGVTTLQTLCVHDTAVNDASLVQLNECQNLKLIVLRRSGVTRAGIDALRKSHPQCSIQWDEGTIDPN